MRDLFAPVREANWLTAGRARAWLHIAGAVILFSVLLWVGASRAGLDPAGNPLGADFLSFWSASKLALEGRPAAAYDLAAHHAVQVATLRSRHPDYFAFFYPPPFLLACLPLALAPYLVALAGWLAATFTAYLLAIRRWLPKAAGLLPAAAFPAVFTNLAHGQNAFLTTALFAAGAGWLGARPLLAGACLGALAIKPHLGLLIPVALVAAGLWRAFAAATLTVLGLAAASWLAFGSETWRAFFAVSGVARQALEQELVGAARMQSVFAAVRLLHGPVPLAYLAQGLAAVAAAGVVWQVGRRRASPEALGAVTVAGTLIATPFLLDYDLMLAAAPMAWLLRQGAAAGFRPWEKAALLAAFVLPLVSRTVATDAGVPLGPPVLAALFVVVARRALSEAPRSAPAAPSPRAARAPSPRG